MSIEQVSQVLALGEGRFEAQVPEGWGQGRAVYGGLLAAMVQSAAAASLPEPRPLRTLTFSFVAPAAPGRVELEARVLRHGRALTQVEVRLLGAGGLVAVGVLAYGPGRDTGLVLEPAPQAAAAAPEQAMPFPYLPGITPEFTQQFEYRWIDGPLPFSGANDAAYSAWIRSRSGRVGVNTLLGALDAFPCPALALAQRPIPASSVSWLVGLVRVLPPEGWPEGTWLRLHSRSRVSLEGFADVSGALYDAEGVLWATTRQVVAEFNR